MAKLNWNQDGERFYETGVQKGVLYPKTGENNTYSEGIAWNGLTGVTESPSGAEVTAIYADDTKYLNLVSKEEFGATIEAYMYPDEFAQCDGSAALASGIVLTQQSRKQFGFSYRTTVGNDQDGDNKGYKIHLIYNCLASPSERTYGTVNDSPEAITFSWEVQTTPVEVSGYKPTSHVIIDSVKVSDDSKLKAIEAILYGVDAPEFSATKTYAIGDFVTYESTTYVCKTAIAVAAAWDAQKWTETSSNGPRLPLPEEVISIMGV